MPHLKEVLSRLSAFLRIPSPEEIRRSRIEALEFHMAFAPKTLDKPEKVDGPKKITEPELPKEITENTESRALLLYSMALYPHLIELYQQIITESDPKAAVDEATTSQIRK